ncbi:YfiR family protein [bacterium AH-315-E07]|nr:YfiR family protein [bacterium AH-315-E07]
MHQRAKLLSSIFSMIVLLQIVACQTVFAKNTVLLDEYKIEAAYLFHLASYVHWPARHRAGITICIVGNDPFGVFLDEIIKAKPFTRNAVPVFVKRLAVGRGISRCNIAFIDIESISEKFWNAVPKYHSVLLVSNSPTFTQRDGMVKFYSENNRIRIEVHLQNVKNAGLRISSELLKLVKLTPSGSAKGTE